MAAIAMLDVDETVFTLRVEWLYTLARLLKSPYASAFAPEFQLVGPVLDAAIGSQGNLDDAAVMAAAGRDAADEILDPVIIQILAAILVITKGDRDDPFYVSYAGDQTALQVTRPVLGPELVTASDWITPLTKETDPTLLGFVQPLTDAVKTGKDAEDAVKTSDKALSDFRLVGERKKAVDTLNAARLSVFGKLGKYQADHTDLRLPAGWPAGFFRHAVKTSRFGRTVAQAKAHLDALVQETKDATAFLEDLQKKETAYEAAKAKRDKARLDLAEARKAAKLLKEQEKALKAEATKKLKK